MEVIDLIFVCVIVAGVAVSIFFRKLSRPAAIVGGVVALCLYTGFGAVGILLLGTFFVTASVATKIGAAEKLAIGVAEKNDGLRTTGQVLANGGAAAILGIAAILAPLHADSFGVMAAAALASATSDTLSSELGSVYGKKFYNILTFKKDQRGADGVVSLQGSAWGVAGSAIISVLYGVALGFDVNVLWIFIAGIIGNLADSVLGALFERKGLLSNNMVNGFNTIFASLTALAGLWLTVF